jgi:hypothetical protein
MGLRRVPDAVIRLHLQAARHAQQLCFGCDRVQLERMAVAAVVNHDVLEHFPGAGGVDDVGAVAQHEGDADAFALRQRRGRAAGGGFRGAGAEQRDRGRERSADELTSVHGRLQDFDALS